MSLIFTVTAAALASAIALWMGCAIWRGGKAKDTPAHHDVNAAVLRDQLAELKRDLTSQALSASDFSAAEQELQQRALHEAAPGSRTQHGNSGDKRSAVVLTAILPVAAVALYFYLGNPDAMEPVVPQSAPTMTQADVENMVASLEARLAQNPDDPEGWLMLGRSYRYFGRYKEAADAYFKAAPIVQISPVALTEYAEALARSSGQGFTKEAVRQLERALLLDPQEPFALTLAGTAAFQRGDHQEAIGYWQTVLELLPPGSEAAQAIADGIETARRDAGGAVDNGS